MVDDYIENRLTLEDLVMNEQTFWNMLADGRLAALAKKDPLEFEHLYEKIVEQALTDSGNGEQLRPYSDMLLIKLLWDTHPFEFQSELGQKQPELFALRRRIILNAFHRQHTDEKHPDRGKAIQWRVDREIERHTTPPRCLRRAQQNDERKHVGRRRPP